MNRNNLYRSVSLEHGLLYAGGPVSIDYWLPVYGCLRRWSVRSLSPHFTFQYPKFVRFAHHLFYDSIIVPFSLVCSGEIFGIPTEQRLRPARPAQYFSHPEKQYPPLSGRSVVLGSLPVMFALPLWISVIGRYIKH